VPVVVRRAQLALLAPAVFGAFDGANSIIGLLGGVPPAHVVTAAWHVAISAGMSMGAGQWLSERSRSGRLSALVIGVATALGTLWPALPYTVLRGWSALTAVGVALVLLGAVISLVRTRMPAEGDAEAVSLRRAAFETYIAMALVCAAVAVAGG
jgi:VIT1/CCC1 family predicted Fe2+/Mn2+ transporter